MIPNVVLLGATTEKVSFPRFSLVLVTITYCEVDYPSCCALLLIQPMFLLGERSRSSG